MPGSAMRGAASATAFQRYMGVAAWVMVVVGPVWVGAGHSLLGGGGGWVILFHVLRVLPIYVVLALVHAVLVTVRSRRVKEFAAGQIASIVSFVFLLATVAYPFFVADFGDASDSEIPARVTAWFGMSGDASFQISIVLLAVMAVAIIAAIVADSVDLSRTSNGTPRYGTVR